MSVFRWPEWVSFEEDRLFKAFRTYKVNGIGIYHVPVVQPVDVNGNHVDLFEFYTYLVKVYPAEACAHMPSEVFCFLGKIVMKRFDRKIQRFFNNMLAHMDLSLKPMFEEKKPWYSQHPRKFVRTVKTKYRSLFKSKHLGQQEEKF